MEVRDSIGLGVDRGIGSEFVSVDGIKFGINDEPDMGYSRDFFYGTNYINPVALKLGIMEKL